MKITEKINPKTKLKLEPGFKQFLWKTGIFVVLFAIIQLVLILLQAAVLPKEYNIIGEVNMGKALLLTTMILFLLIKNKLKEISKYKYELRTLIIFMIISAIRFAAYDLLR